jgi:hypothetical protein
VWWKPPAHSLLRVLAGSRTACESRTPTAMARRTRARRSRRASSAGRRAHRLRSGTPRRRRRSPAVAVTTTTPTASASRCTFETRQRGMRCNPGCHEQGHGQHGSHRDAVHPLPNPSDEDIRECAPPKDNAAPSERSWQRDRRGDVRRHRGIGASTRARPSLAAVAKDSSVAARQKGTTRACQNIFKRRATVGREFEHSAVKEFLQRKGVAERER